MFDKLGWKPADPTIPFGYKFIALWFTFWGASIGGLGLIASIFELAEGVEYDKIYFLFILIGMVFYIIAKGLWKKSRWGTICASIISLMLFAIGILIIVFNIKSTITFMDHIQYIILSFLLFLIPHGIFLYYLNIDKIRMMRKK